MGAFVLAGAREKIGDQNRCDQPGKDHHLEQARDAAHAQIDRERRQRDHAAEQPRRDEGAMARRRQCILLRRRMNQAVEVVPQRREQTHDPCARPPIGTRPLYLLGRIVSEAA